jgi:hypothetical protein
VEHLLACQGLCDGIRRGVIDESLLAELETRNPVFPALDLDVLG